MFNLSPSVRIFVSTKPVDMRRGFDGLFGLVQGLTGQDHTADTFSCFEASAATSSSCCGGTLTASPFLQNDLK